MRVAVLGAGLLGVSSAWYLAAAGHEVTLIDRQAEAALETSCANGGQISTSHAEPWATPRAPWQALQWLGHEDAPLLWRVTADPAQWAWGLRFLRECTPARMQRNVAAILRLALYSRAQLQSLRAELGLQYDQLQRGILHYYTDAREFERACLQAAHMRELGCAREPVSAAQCFTIEPALSRSTVAIVGGTFTAQDESGDAKKFTQALARHCADRGVLMRYGSGIAALEAAGGRIARLRLMSGETLAADAYVVALGSWSPLLLRPLGIHLPVYPAKGYSVTLPLQNDEHAPQVSLTDDHCKIVYSRLGQRLRVAGTAEFTGYNTEISAARCAAILRRVAQIFPHLEFDREAVEHWAGLRPATPGNVPLIGPARYANLFVNTGHGTLGWTLACGSGKLLADLISQRAPDVAPAAYAADNIKSE